MLDSDIHCGGCNLTCDGTSSCVNSDGFTCSCTMSPSDCPEGRDFLEQACRFGECSCGEHRHCAPYQECLGGRCMYP